ncbi:MAG: hypothetical protein LBQ58_05340 [Synergistaceae bacterium]|nr:hypothetical protein [Synergistaceae bacterium]
MKSKLAREIEKAIAKGYSVARTGSGIITDNPNSNLQFAIAVTREQYPGKEIDYVVGARAGQSSCTGHFFAIIYR